MENVVPDSIQLIHKGQPVNGSDVPKMLDLQSMEILEVCRVPGVDTTPPPKSASPAANHMSVEEKSGTTTTITRIGTMPAPLYVVKTMCRLVRHTRLDCPSLKLSLAR